MRNYWLEDSWKGRIAHPLYSLVNRGIDKKESVLAFLVVK